MVEVKGKFIHFKDESFGEGDNRFEKYVVVLENEKSERTNQSLVTLSIPSELVTKYKLTDSKVIDNMRSKIITIKGDLYDYSQGYTDKNGNPRTRLELKFVTKDIVFDSVK